MLPLKSTLENICKDNKKSQDICKDNNNKEDICKDNKNSQDQTMDNLIETILFQLNQLPVPPH